MIYKVKITNGYVGYELNYLCCERDYLESLCYTDYIIDDLSSFVGSPYPIIEDIMSECGVDEYDATEIRNAEIANSIEFIRTPVTINDLDNYYLIDESCIQEDDDEFTLYRGLLRELEIDKLLKD